MSGNWLLLLDFDGTLTPIARLPREAKLSSATQKLLKQLSEKENVYLAVVSGRKLDDIKEKIGLSDIIYGGNHGLEGEIFGEKYAFPIPVTICRDFKKIKKDLTQISNKFNGIFIEDKKLTLSFHYRKADPKQVSEIKLLFHKVLQSYIINKSIFVRQGNKVLDVMPNLKCNKGTFAELIIKKIKLLTNRLPIIVAIGDDKTDEDIFRKVKKGITIKVGKNQQTSAKYILQDTGEVVRLLQWFVDKF